MRSDQTIVVGGTLNGERITTPPLPAAQAIQRFNVMKAQGYTLLSMTDAASGEDYVVSPDQFPTPQGTQ